MSSSSSITRLERRCPDVRTGPFNGVSGYLQGDFSRRLMVVGANRVAARLLAPVFQSEQAIAAMV